MRDFDKLEQEARRYGEVTSGTLAMMGEAMRSLAEAMAIE